MMNELTRRIGKFESPETLLKAYESLEAEFTKRCQRLKEFEKENTELKESAADKARIVESAKTVLKDDGFVTEHVLSDEGITSRVITQYLENINANGAPGLLGARAGGAVLTPPKRPKSLEEAKRLAEVIFNS